MKRRGLLPSLILLAPIPLVGGCDAVSVSDPPGEARVQVDGPAGAEVRIVASNNFALGGFDFGEVELIEADTVTAVLPYEQMHSLAPTYWFVVRVLPPAEGTMTLSLTVHVSGRQPHAETRTLTAGEETFLQYHFTYQ